jgi:hypothetical protein
VEGEFYSGIVELTQELLLSIWLQDGRITGNKPFRNLKLRYLKRACPSSKSKSLNARSQASPIVPLPCRHPATGIMPP